MSSGENPERTPLEPADLVGSVVAGRYSLAHLVSAGANTSIYQASDDETGRPVSVKLVQASLAASPSFRDRFDQQMRAVSALSHPDIVALYDWGVTAIGDASTAFVVTERLDGGSLRDMFDRGRRLSPSQALVVGLDACRGLDHAHRRGFVHTEVTPSKIVFGDDRRVRIADLGLARLLGEPGWRRPETVDNHVAWYSAPEQAAGGPIDGRTDVYALCLTLHEAVTGELPFKTDSTVATLTARVGKLMPVSADLGPLAAVFERAGRPDIADRSTAAEFGKGLVQAASKLPRPEPLPLLSTGLFDTPADQLREPGDPTGGVTKPASRRSAPVLVVPATPDDPTPDDRADNTDDLASDGTTAAADDTTAADGSGAADTDAADDAPNLTELPEAPLYGDVTAGDELVILPVDSELDGGPEGPPVPAAAADRELPATTPMATTPASRPAQPSAASSPAEPPRRRRGFPWKMALAVLLAAALILLGILATQLFETPAYPVPDLVGVPEAEARNLIAANDWDISIERERSDAEPDPGDVVRTVPAAGTDTLVAEGEPFLLVVSDGPVLRELPDSIGLTLADAQDRLLARDLEVAVREEYDEDVPVGVVVSWSVPGDPTLAAGSFVEPQTSVELIVSRGPEPREVPEVVALPASDARAQLDELGLEFVQERQEFSDDVPLGYVISQTPESGEIVERGDAVSVVVSRGPDLVTFPNLPDAATYEEAAEILTESGFVPMLTFGDAEGEITEITVDGEEPAVGDTYRRGTEVEIEAI